MSEEICDSVYSSLARAFVHTSTFSENSLAMRAGLATLEVLERENLGWRSIDAGEYLQVRLSETLGSYEMVKEVRGLGLLMGIEFQLPRQLRLRIPCKAFGAVHAWTNCGHASFPQLRFFDSGMGNNFMVLKIAPPLLVNNMQMDAFVRAVNDVVELANSPGPFWSGALGLARRAFRS